MRFKTWRSQGARSSRARDRAPNNLTRQEVRDTARQIEKRLVELRGEQGALKPGADAKIAEGLRVAGHGDAKVYGQWRSKALLAAALAELEDKEVWSRVCEVFGSYT